jgi:hypothetical protein
MMSLAPEGDTGYVQTTFANVANRDGSLGVAASAYSSKAERTGDGELARRRITGNGYGVRTGWVVAQNLKRSCFRPNGTRLEANRKL